MRDNAPPCRLLRSGRSGQESWRWFSFLLALILSSMAIAAAPAQGGPPPGVRVSLVTESPELTVGDLVTLSLIVSHPEDFTVVVPRIKREWGQFEVQAQTSVQTVSLADGIRTVAKQFRVTLFSPGTFETPHLPVSIRGPDGTLVQVSPDPVQLTVNSVLSSPNDQLKDLRPPADLETPFWRRPVALVIAALAVVAILGGTGFFFYRRSRGSTRTFESAPDTRTPWEVAAQELDRIVRLDLPARGEMREHYTLLSGVLRTYLGATYLAEAGDQDVKDMSTEEIADWNQQSALDPAIASVVIDVLREADLVKFANQAPTPGEASESVAQVRGIIEASRATVAGTTSVGRAMPGIAR